MNPRTRDFAEREEKKCGRDVKIRRNEKKDSVIKGNTRRWRVRESQNPCFKYFISTCVGKKKVREEGARERSELIEVENATHALKLLPFSSSFAPASPIKLRTYKREGLIAAVDLRSREILPKRGEPHRGVHLCPVSF